MLHELSATNGCSTQKYPEPRGNHGEAVLPPRQQELRVERERDLAPRATLAKDRAQHGIPRDVARQVSTIAAVLPETSTVWAERAMLVLFGQDPGVLHIGVAIDARDG